MAQLGMLVPASDLECTVNTFFLSTTYYSELKSGTTRLSRGEQRQVVVCGGKIFFPLYRLYK
jgi:hypothetical protein